jgi:Gpi18-like mannosyltransferase
MTLMRTPTPVRPRWQPVVLIVLLVVAVLIRMAFVDYQSPDYRRFLEPWATFIDQHGGFRALRYSFSNYNAPYLYLMAAASYLPLSPLITVKLISAIFEVMLGWYVYRLLGLRYPTGWMAPTGALVVLLLPTVVLNGAMWGQADSTYGALAVGGLYYLLLRKDWRACVLLGLALAFKLQVVFLFPALLLFALRRWVRWQALLATPAVYLLLDVPALLLGAKPQRLLFIYLYQAHSHNKLSINAPTIYNYVPIGPNGLLKYIAALLAGVILLGLVVFADLRRVELTPTRIVLIATLSVLLTPYLLPSMHERYFYLADVLTVVAAFWLPRRYSLLPVPLLVQYASLTCYLNYLLQVYRRAERTGQPIPPANRGGSAAVHYLLYLPSADFRILSTAIAAGIVLVLYAVIREFQQPALAGH